MPINHDSSFVDNLTQNVAVQFLDRVAASAERGLPLPRGETWSSVTWQRGGRPGRAPRRRPALARASSPSSASASRPATRYEWILADLAVMCAAGATTTVYPTTNAEDTTYILSDSECRVVFAEDDEQIAKLTANKAELPHVGKVVTFDGTTDGDWVIGLDDLAALGDAYLADTPRRRRRDGRRDLARPARDADLHLRHHRPAQGRPAAAPVMGLRGHRDPGAEHPRRERPAVPLAADGPLVRQGAAVRPARVRLRDRHRRPGRQDRRQPRQS